MKKDEALAVISLAVLFSFELQRRLLPRLLESDVSSRIFVPAVFIVLFLAAMALNRKRRWKKALFRLDGALGSADGDVYVLGNQVLLSTANENVLGTGLVLEPVRGERTAIKFEEIAGMIVHVGVGVVLSLSMWEEPGGKRVHWLSRKERDVIRNSAVVWLWTTITERGDLASSRVTLKRAVRMLKSSLGHAFYIEQPSGQVLKRFFSRMPLSFWTFPSNAGGGIEVETEGLERPSPPPTGSGPGIGIGRTPEGDAFELDLDDLNHHVAILGRTGSGKTTTAMAIVSRAWEQGIPVLIFDYEDEYRGLVMRLGGRVLTPRKKLVPMALNALKGLRGPESDLLDVLLEVFSMVFDFTPPQVYLFSKALLRLQKQAAEFEEDPNLSDLFEELANQETRGVPEQESKQALLRKLSPLVRGEAGSLLSKEEIPTTPDLLGSLTSIELGGIRTQGAREIFIFILLKRIYDHVKASGRSKLTRHVVVVEEAEKVLPRIRDVRELTIGDRMLSELRKYGEGIVVISQSPANLSPHVLRNASTRILHALGSTRDFEAIRSILGTSRKEINRISHSIHYLESGECLVSLRNRPEPTRVRIELPYNPQDLEEDEALTLISAAPSFYLAGLGEISDKAKSVGPFSPLRFKPDSSRSDQT